MLQQDSGSKTVEGNPGSQTRSKLRPGPDSDKCESRSIHKESDSVTSFVLAPIDGQSLPAFQAGQFVVLRLLVDSGQASSVFAAIRCLICPGRSLPHQRQERIEWDWKFISVQPYPRRRRVGCQRAARKFYPAPRRESCGSAERRSRCNARDVDAARTRRRKITTGNLVDLWSAQSRRSSICGRIAFSLKQLSRGRSIHCVQQARCNRPSRGTSMLQGTLTQLCWRKLAYHADSDFYLCGPSSFLQNMRDGLRNWGVPAGNVHTEIFGALEGITPGMAQVDHTPHLPQGPPGSGPSVSFARSGITVAWDPKFGSLA